MRPEEIKELLDAKPFAPFRLHMTDGNSLDITQPDNAIVSRAKIVLGVGSDAATGIADHIEHCALLHIVRVEELKAA